MTKLLLAAAINVRHLRITIKANFKNRAMKNLHTIIRDDEEIRLPLMKSLVAIADGSLHVIRCKGAGKYTGCRFPILYHDQFPGAMVGNNLDTSSAITLGVHRISIENYPGPTVANLDGIQYFKNLDTLQLDFNHAPLSFPSILPSHLSFLFIQNVDISDSLNHLPASLKVVALNELYRVPYLKMPSSLQRLGIWRMDSLSNLDFIPATLENPHGE